MEQIEIDFQNELKGKIKRQQNGCYTIMHGVKKIVFNNPTDDENIVNVFKEFYPFEYEEMLNSYANKVEQEAIEKANKEEEQKA